MANRFEKGRGGFLDTAIEARKNAKSFCDNLEGVVDWRPMDKILRKKPRRSKAPCGSQPTGRFPCSGRPVATLVKT